MLFHGRISIEWQATIKGIIKCTSVTVWGLLDLVIVTVLLSTTCSLLLLLMHV